jgi:hypothetical protein
VNYIFHCLPHFVIFVAFCIFSILQIHALQICHIPFSIPTSTKASAFIKSQRKGHNILRYYGSEDDEPSSKRALSSKLKKTVVFLTRILEIPGSNVGLSQNILQFSVGCLFPLSTFQDTSDSLRWLSSTFFAQVIFLLTYHPPFDAV